MSDTILTVTVGVEGLTLSNAVWRQFKKIPLGFVEKTLGLNPGLALNDIIPSGTVINFPIEELTTSAGTDPNIIRLWD